MGKRWLWLVLYLLLAVIFLEGLAPSLVTRGANWALGEVLSSEADVQLWARPRSKMLFGMFDRVRVEFHKVRLRGGVVVDRLLFETGAVQLDLGSLFLEQQFRTSSPLTMRVRAELGEPVLSGLWADRTPAGNAGPVVISESIAFFVRLPVLGSEVELRVEGMPRVVYHGESPTLEIVPIDVYVEGRKLPEPIRSATLGLIDPDWLTVPLDVGLGVRWTEARAEPGKLILQGIIDRQARDLVLPMAGHQ